jgi:hypothetical protein
MKTRIHITHLLVITLFLVSFSACKDRKGQDSGKQESGLDESGKLHQQQFIKKLETVNPGLKDPSGIVHLIEMTGAGFIPDLVNDSGMDSYYMEDSARAAINLGVYTVDLVYLLTYEQDEKADLFLEKARLIAERIGAGHLYDYSMYQRYRSAGVPSDTLIKYFSRSAESLEHEFREMELLRLSTLFATGEFIEKLHLTTSLLVNADKEDMDHYWTIMILVFQQEKALDNLILLLEQIRGDEEGERFMAMMKDLKQLYAELNSSNEMAGINTHNITDNQIFIDLVDHLGRVRDYIIQPE